ncbi:hypothetical protein BB341_14870 [Streptomyces clavuligerus]|nr:hypothetical protein BB341_14870 [Streptomyces clavuligerus]AXU14017.1 hypothetical protein D1794_15515 [Streptomyces clavuligerus]QCS06790.1 hypothetical protein CRV15_14870 [Streptomyces clavuligerus]
MSRTATRCGSSATWIGPMAVSAAFSVLLLLRLALVPPSLPMASPEPEPKPDSESERHAGRFAGAPASRQ